MSLRGITLCIAVLYLLGSGVEVHRYLQGDSTLFFEDFPGAVYAWIVTGALFLAGYILFSNFSVAKPILIFTAALALLTNSVRSLYNSYVAFGNSFEALPWMVPILLIQVGVVAWYIRAVLNHGKHESS